MPDSKIIAPEGFVVIRSGLFEHVSSGRMSPLALAMYSFILYGCIWKTGVRHGSAPKLQHALGGYVPLRTVQRHLNKLVNEGYLKSFNMAGKRGNYPTLIDKYRPTEGALIGYELNAAKSTDWKHPVYEPVGEVTLTRRIS